jgi:hypothetical protein
VPERRWSVPRGTGDEEGPVPLRAESAENEEDRRKKGEEKGRMILLLHSLLPSRFFLLHSWAVPYSDTGLLILPDS